MSDDRDPPKNPFVRWKQHVDAHIGLTLNSLLGIPAVMSKTLNMRPDDGAGSAGDGKPADSQSKPVRPSQLPSGSSARPYSDATALASSPSAAGPNSSPNNNNSSSPSDPGNVLDGVDAAQLLEWHKFIYYSPYSPLKLAQHQPQPDDDEHGFSSSPSGGWPRYGPFSQEPESPSSHHHHHQHRPFGFCKRGGRWGRGPPSSGPLPPPVPQDVPFGADPFAFTYADAFEDLLRASSGLPLIDLAARSYRNIRYQMRYGSAIEPPYVFFHRMHSEKLLDAYFPKGVPVNGLAHHEDDEDADTVNDSVVQAAAGLAAREKAWEMEKAEEADEGVVMGRVDKNENDEKDDEWLYEWDNDEDKDGNHAAENDNNNNKVGLFDELDRVFRVLGRIIDENTSDKTDSQNSAGENKTSDSKEAAAEDELYNAVRSAYADAEKSLGTFIKSVTDIASPLDGDVKSSSSSSSSSDQETKTETTEVNDNGTVKKEVVTTTTTSSSSSSNSPSSQQLQTIRTTEEHTDVFGNRHVKTEVRRLDGEGREVSRETRYSVRSSSADDEPKETERCDKAEEKKAEEKKAGWFWK